MSMDTEALRDLADGVFDIDHRSATPAWRALYAAADEIDQLRSALVSAEGYALVSGADLPFVSMFVEDSPTAAVIERAGCYPRSARREHPGRFALNPPDDR